MQQRRLHMNDLFSSHIQTDTGCSPDAKQKNKVAPDSNWRITDDAGEKNESSLVAGEAFSAVAVGSRKM